MSTINAAVDGIVLTADSSATLSLATSGVIRANIDGSGNLNFVGTAQRITGDFSNATPASRLMFQTSTTNGNTFLYAIPNGTSQIAAVTAANASDPNNSSWVDISPNATEGRIRSGIAGTGTYLPMTFYTGGSERMRLDTSGNLGIGTASPSKKLEVVGDGRFTSSGSTDLSLSTSSASTSTIHVIGALSNSGFDYANLTISSNLTRFNISGTERMRIDGSGNVGIGGTSAGSAKVSLLGTAPSASNLTFGYYQNMTLPSSTTSAYLNYTIPAIASGATVTTLAHFFATQGTFTGGATNQFGFLADSGLTGATNNYGFYSNIASGSNRWNFYAAGTAKNYFAGETGFGVTPSGFPVDVLCNSSASGLRLRGRSSDNISVLRFTSNDGSTNYGQFDVRSTGFLINAVANIPIDFYTNNTLRATINTAGELIAGGTVDQGAYNLQCNGTGVWGAGAYVNGSDARLKDDITTLNDGLNVVSQLRPVTFKYKPDYSKDQNVQTGFIAQELQAVLANKDYVDGIVQAGPNHLNVAYQSLIPLLTKAIQEQQAMIDELKAKVAALETK